MDKLVQKAAIRPKMCARLLRRGTQLGFNDGAVPFLRDGMLHGKIVPFAIACIISLIVVHESKLSL